jgi:O-antigen/teichoic acid export membrane protein
VVGSRSSLGQKSLALLVATWLGTSVNLVCGILIARVLGPDAVGSLSFGLGLAGIVMAALVPGFSQAHTKRIAEGADPGVCIATFGLIKLALYVPFLLLAALATPYRGLLFETPALETVFVMLFAGRVLSSFGEIFTIALVAQERVVQHASVLLAARGLRLVMTVLVLLWAPDVTRIAVTFALEGLVELTSAWLAVRLWLGIRLRAPTRASLGGYWEYARPMLVSVPIGMLQDSVDRVVVKQWAGLSAAGYYHIARGFWEILGSINAYPALFLFTRMSALFAPRSPERDREARALFYSGMDKLLFIATPLGLVLWLIAEPLITAVFGPAFRPAASAVRVFVLANLAATLTNNYTQVLYALEAHGRLVPVVVWRAALYLALLALLVPREPLLGWVPALGLGATGAALGRLFLLVFPAWMYPAWTRELAGVGFFDRSWLYVGGFAAAVAASAAATQLAHWANTPPAVGVPVAALAGFAVFAGLIGALHPAVAETLRYCKDLVSPARLASFLRREIGKP